MHLYHSECIDTLNAIRIQEHNYVLSVTSHINCIVDQSSTGLLPDKPCLSHGMYLYKVMKMLHFLNDIANDASSTQK